MSNNQFNLHFETELNEGARVITLSPVFCSGDDEAHSFIVKALRKGKPVSLNGATVRGFFIRPDNVTITLEGSVNADGEAVVTLSDSCYNKQGRFQLVIRATINGVASTLFCGLGGMLIASTDTFIDDGNVIATLDDLLNQIDAMQEATARANEAADRADPDAIAQTVLDMVLEELGASVIGSVDANNNIILTGNLAAGTYTLKYENEDGTIANIGTVEVTDSAGDGDSGEDTDESGEVPITWKINVKINKDTGIEEADTSGNYASTEPIELKDGYTYTLYASGNDVTSCPTNYFYYYDANGGFLGYTDAIRTHTQTSAVVTPPDGAKTFKIRTWTLTNEWNLLEERHTLMKVKN